VICPLTLPGPKGENARQVLVRYGGFAGYELGGQLDIFDPEAERWETIDLGQHGDREGEGGYPEKRSVHSLTPVEPAVSILAASSDDQDGERSIVALMLFGEKGPAPAHLGHAGAGQFHRDAWALVHRHPRTGSPGTTSLVFEKLEQVTAGRAGVDVDLPVARGWFGAAGYGNGVVIWGGLEDGNERLGDCWIGKLEG
jgi:hypothetical protein